MNAMTLTTLNGPGVREKNVASTHSLVYSKKNENTLSAISVPIHRHCEERSNPFLIKNTLDCFVPRNDGHKVTSSFDSAGTGCGSLFMSWIFCAICRERIYSFRFRKYNHISHY